LQDQISYLFSNTVPNNIGSPGSATQVSQDATLANNPRLGANLSYDTATFNPAPSAVAPGLVPFVDSTGQPFGLGAGETNFVISPNLKDPYSIALNVGVQQEL